MNIRPLRFCWLIYPQYQEFYLADSRYSVSIKSMCEMYFLLYSAVEFTDSNTFSGASNTIHFAHLFIPIFVEPGAGATYMVGQAKIWGVILASFFPQPQNQSFAIFSQFYLIISLRSIITVPLLLSNKFHFLQPQYHYLLRPSSSLTEKQIQWIFLSFLLLPSLPILFLHCSQSHFLQCK